MENEMRRAIINTDSRINLLKNKEIEEGNLFLNTIFLFFTVFSIHFKGMPMSITPRIIVMLYIIIRYNGRRVLNILNVRISKSDLIWVASSLFVFIYSWVTININYIEPNARTIMSSAFNFFVFVTIFPYFAECLFKDAVHFCKCLVYACMIQSIIVLMSFAFSPVRNVLESIQAIDFTGYGWRIVGLGVAGAGGSVYLFCGLVAAGYLLVKGNRGYLIFIEMFVIFTAIALVGRTGFYAALLLLLYLVNFSARSIRERLQTNKRALIIILVFTALGYIALLIMDGINMDLLKYTFYRLWELFRDGSSSRTLQYINNIDQAIPGLSLETIIGTGIIRGTTSSGLVFMHDGGYVQRYAALGIVVCIFSYIAFIRYILKLTKQIPRLNRWYIVFCLFIMYVLEYKEPFIYMLAYPFTLTMICRLSHKEESIKKGYGRDKEMSVLTENI